jgi:hypothetical protein
MTIQNKHSIFALTLFAATIFVVVGCDKSDTEKVGADVKATAQDTATATKDALSTGKDKVVEVATNVAASVTTATSNAWNGTKNVSSNAWNSTKSATTNAVNKVSDLVR